VVTGRIIESNSSQKYYKLRNDSGKPEGSRSRSQTSTPSKRKAEDVDEVKPSPAKRTKSSVKHEQIDAREDSKGEERVKSETASLPSGLVQQQELWDPFQYRGGFGSTENSQLSQAISWGTGLAPDRDF
jgi:hypothetical protein